MKERGIYTDMKCHHWSGGILFQGKSCRHRFRKGYTARSMEISNEQALDYYNEFIKKGKKK